MVKWKSKMLGDLLLMGNAIVLAVIINQFAGIYFFRHDMTEEKRYTIKQPTREFLQNLPDDVYIEVYLEGDLNAGFRRLNKAIRELLEEFRVHSKNKVHFTFTDPATAMGNNARNEFMTSLSSRGIMPLNVIDTKDGQRTEKLVFPGALISYGGAEKGLMLLKDKAGQRKEEVINQSVEDLEYEFGSAIRNMTNEARRRVGFVRGHGELDDARVSSLSLALTNTYEVGETTLIDRRALQQFQVLIIAKPTLKFPERDKYNLDQFIMQGGRVLFMLDRLEANMDSITRDDYFAFPYDLGLDDLLFRYGVRQNQDLVQDRNAVQYPIVTGTLNGRPQITPIEWPFFPLVNHYAGHVITRNLDASVLKFSSSVDTVKAEGIRKTPLLFTSQYARRINAPVRINANDLRKQITPENFSAGPIPMAYLLEGKFSSLFRNRFIPEGADTTANRKTGIPTSLIVVSDGDVAKNDINGRTGQPHPLGLDIFSGYTFGNQELLTNMVDYLSEGSGLIEARSRVVRVRPLDKDKIKNNRAMIQAINLVLPVLLVVLAGMLKSFFRKRRYGTTLSRS